MFLHWSFSFFYCLCTVNQWLQIDVGPPTLITGVLTKGRGDSKKKHWVKRFKISYSNDTQRWYEYKDAHSADPRVSSDPQDMKLYLVGFFLWSLIKVLCFFNTICWNRCNFILLLMDIVFNITLHVYCVNVTCKWNQPEILWNEIKMNSFYMYSKCLKECFDHKKLQVDSRKGKRVPTFDTCTSAFGC